jgi:hypothetical protein
MECSPCSASLSTARRYSASVATARCVYTRLSTPCHGRYIAGAVAFDASIVCGITIGGAAAGLAAYAAGNAFSSRWSGRNAPIETGIGAVSGFGLEGAGRFAASSRSLSRPTYAGSRGFRVHFDRKVHRMRWLPAQVRMRSHWQVDTWHRGVPGSHRTWRFPAWKAFR